MSSTTSRSNGFCTSGTPRYSSKVPRASGRVCALAVISTYRWRCAEPAVTRNRAEHPRTVQIGHLEVKQHDQGPRSGAEALQRGEAVTRFADRMALLFEGGPKGRSNARVIVHDEDVRHLLTPPFFVSWLGTWQVRCQIATTGARGTGGDVHPARCSLLAARCLLPPIGHAGASVSAA